MHHDTRAKSNVYNYLVFVILFEVEDDDSYSEEEDEDYYPPHTCTCDVRASSSHADDNDH